MEWAGWRRWWRIPTCGHVGTSYHYDWGDRLVRVEQGDQVRIFAYDSLGRLVRSEQPENGRLDGGALVLGVIEYRYDANGNLVSKTSPVGPVGAGQTATIGYEYDALNRLRRKAYPDGSEVKYCFDGDTSGGGCLGAPGGRLLIDRLTLVTAPAATTKYLAYDELGQVLKSQAMVGGETYPAFEYEYNLAGGLSAMRYPSGRRVAMTFDAAGRVNGVSGRQDGEGKSQYATG